MKDKDIADGASSALRERISNAALIATVALTGLTLIVFRMQLEEMQKAYAPIRDQAVASQKSVELAERTAARQLRAYILFDGGLVDRFGHGFMVKLAVKNSGQTPAYNLTYAWDAKVLPYPLKVDGIIYPSPNPEQSADIGASISTTLGDPQFLAMSEQDVQDVQNRMKAVYVFASLSYRDTFQRTQTAQFVAVNLPQGPTDPSSWAMRNYFSSVSDSPCPRGSCGP
jgi:hypothetical protein